MFHLGWQSSIIFGPAFNAVWAWVKTYLPYAIPAIVNLFLVLAGIFLSFQHWIDYIENDKHSTLRRVIISLCIAVGLLGFWFDAVDRYKNDSANHELIENVQKELGETDTLLKEIRDVKTNVSSIPAIREQIEKINRVQNQLSEAQKAHDTVREAELKKELSDAKTAKIVLSKQVISNGQRIVEQLRELGRSWNSEEAHAKDENERSQIHGAWNSRFPVFVGNARAVTRQLLSLLPEMSHADQLEEIKTDGQLLGGTGPAEIQKDADYLEALIKRVIAANPELAK